jgi:phage minor structural protein
MYQISILNNIIETIIHYPNTDKEAPHLDKLPLKEGLSQVDSLSFSIYTNNPGYNNLFELTTKVKVIDIRDTTTRFVGRVLDVNEKMGSNGLFYKEVLCEGALSYLNDSKQRANTFITANVATFLTQILAIHNAKVDVSKQIQVGNVDVIGSVAHSCSFETTLAAILKVKEKSGGDIRVRETLGILYLDWLQSFSVNTVNVTLGENMKDMIKGKDVTSLGTQIIPLGANNLTIASVNGGVDYIEDTVAKNTYGAIEKTVEYKDIIDVTELKNICIADLFNYTQPLFLLESNALDLSYLTGNKAEQFILGTNLHLVNPVMGVDNIYKVVQIDLDLLKAYDPKLTIANFPIKLSTYINDLRKSSIQNNGVYNNVQIGDAFGIRAVRSDGKVATTLNATEGISIENESKKVFYLDTNGNIIANDGTFNDITANNGIFNNITAINMIATLMRTSNTSSFIIMYDQYMEFYKDAEKIMQLGFDPLNNLPTVRFFNSSTGAEGNGIGLYGTGQIGTLGPMDFDSPVNFYSTVKKNGSDLATMDDISTLQAYVDAQLAGLWGLCVSTFATL